SGGAFYNFSPSFGLTNCILWGNTAGSAPNIQGGGANVRNSCIENSFPGAVWDASLGSNLGGNIDADPDFLDDTLPKGDDDIWGTWDDGLVPDHWSPVINAGLKDADTPSLDIRFVWRRSYPDMGAYEYWNVIYVDKDRNGDGSSWTQAYQDLQDGLDAATPGDQIWVAEGTYYPSVDAGGTPNGRWNTFAIPMDAFIIGGFAGNETSPLESDPEQNPTILSGDVDQNDTLDTGNVYTVVTGDEHVLLEGCTVTMGNNDAGTGGGGMNNIDCSVIVYNCVFEGNYTDDAGAGIYNDNQSLPIMQPWIEKCVFRNNTSYWQGGGVSIEYCTDGTVKDCVFENNTSNNYRGGGLNIWYGTATAQFTVENCVFDGNSAPTYHGGGMSNVYNDAGAITYVKNCVFLNNSADLGGAVEGRYDVVFDFFNCTFLNNIAATDGGAISSQSAAVINVTNCIFDSNVAPTYPDAHLAFGGTAITGVFSNITQAAGGPPSWTDGGSNIANNPYFIQPADPIGPDGLWMTADDGLRLWGKSLLNLPTSIDTGTNGANVPSKDITGADRDAIPDMGAYEGANLKLVFVDLDAAGLDNGTSWADAYPDLTDALWTEGPWTEYWVAEGTYYPKWDSGGAAAAPIQEATFALMDTSGVFGGFDGTETERSERNFDTNITVLSGDIDLNDTLDANNAYTVVVAADQAVLNGFTITNGFGDTAGTVEVTYGAGLFLMDCDMTIQNCVFEENQAGNGGGALMIWDAGASAFPAPQIKNCIFRNNVGGTDIGGAVTCYNETQPVFTNCTFEDNSAPASNGGVIGFWGVGIPASILTVTGCVFDGNTDLGAGGALFFRNCTANILGSAFESNSTASGYGGAINFYNADTTIRNCVFTDNMAFSGGGAVYAGSGCPTNPVLKSSTFHGNWVEGAALTYGGAIYSLDQQIVIDSCILWGNSADQGNEIYRGMATPELAFITNSCIQDAYPGIGTWDTDLGQDDGGNFETNPLFLDAASPAGADGTFRTIDDGLQVKPGSPCLEAGVIGGPVKDILGEDRPQAGTYGIDPSTVGAYEYPRALKDTEGEGSYFGTDGGCGFGRSGSLGLLGILVLAGVLLLGKRHMKYAMLIGLVMLFMVVGTGTVEAQDDDDAPLLFE
ncbi:hypothetical protein ACFL4W_04855, partial [Planctomycetota bacterium]